VDDSMIHKICGTKLVPSGRGDFGYCPKCKKDVHHLILSDGEIQISNEVM